MTKIRISQIITRPTLLSLSRQQSRRHTRLPADLCQGGKDNGSNKQTNRIIRIKTIGWYLHQICHRRKNSIASLILIKIKKKTTEEISCLMTRFLSQDLSQGLV